MTLLFSDFFFNFVKFLLFLFVNYNQAKIGIIKRFDSIFIKLYQSSQIILILHCVLTKQSMCVKLSYYTTSVKSLEFT